jgi:hypothetical protein
MKKLIPFLLIAILTSAVSLGQIKVQELRLDEKITGFKYATLTETGLKVYLPNGKADLSVNALLSTFAIRVNDDMSYERGKEYLNFINSRETKDGAIISNIVERDTIVNGNNIFEMTMVQKFKGLKEVALNYYAFIIKGDQAIIFLSSDFQRGNNLEKFKKTFRNVKL